jgi:POT family proton-dependent oligopeptide transporter
MEIASASRPPWRAEWLGHPIGLPVLFSVEMWERFSFYGMRSILVLYLRAELLPSSALDDCVGAGLVKFLVGGAPTTPGEVQRAASTIYGLYTGFVYMTPLLGGWAADKWLGKKFCVASGLALMGLGHFLMVVPSLFFVGLVLIICGSGFFKPNMSVQLGGLYPAGDSRRDRAFSIFYMGVNLGAFFSPLVVGTIGDPNVLGYRVGFSVAGFGMCAGLVTYCSCQRYLPPLDTDVPVALPSDSNSEDRVGNGNDEDGVPSGSGDPAGSKGEQQRLAALLVVCLTLVFYTIAYEQQGNTIQVFFDDHVDRSMPTLAETLGLGTDWVMPSAWLQAIVREAILNSEVAVAAIATMGLATSVCLRFSSVCALLCVAEPSAHFDDDAVPDQNLALAIN